MEHWGAVDALFACVGIDTAGAGGLSPAVEALMPHAAETVYRGGGSLFDWRDAASGAGVTVTTVTVDNVVQCVTPTFTAGLRTAAVPTAFAEGGHCRFCHPLAVDVVDHDGRVVHALPVRLEDSALTRRRVVPGQPVTLAVAGLVQQVRVWPDAAAYSQAQEGRRGAVPLGSIVPTGLYASTPTAEAMVTGEVRTAEERVNEATGRRFVWMVVQAGAGDLELAMAAGPSVPAPGQVVQALCVVVGRIVDGLGAEPRGLRIVLAETRAGRADARRSQASTASGR